MQPGQQAPQGQQGQPQQRKPTGKSQRRMMNFLLQPLLQMRIGILTTGASLIFVVGIGWYAYHKLVAFSDVVATLTSADSDVKALMADYLASVGMTGAIGSAVFVVINLGLSIYMTHKMVGPTIAFRRHIRSLADYNFSAKTKLREGDAFVEVADELNRLSDRLTEMVRKTL